MTVAEANDTDERRIADLITANHILARISPLKWRREQGRPTFI
jgi:hypothetical protein